MQAKLNIGLLINGILLNAYFKKQRLYFLFFFIFFFFNLTALKTWNCPRPTRKTWQKTADFLIDSYNSIDTISWCEQGRLNRIIGPQAKQCIGASTYHLLS